MSFQKTKAEKIFDRVFEQMVESISESARANERVALLSSNLAAAEARIRDLEAEITDYDARVRRQDAKHEANYALARQFAKNVTFYIGDAISSGSVQLSEQADEVRATFAELPF